MKRILTLTVCIFALCACKSGYTLVEPNLCGSYTIENNCASDISVSIYGGGRKALAFDVASRGSYNYVRDLLFGSVEDCLFGCDSVYVCTMDKSVVYYSDTYEYGKALRRLEDVVQVFESSEPNRTEYLWRIDDSTFE